MSATSKAVKSKKKGKSKSNTGSNSGNQATGQATGQRNSSNQSAAQAITTVTQEKMPGDPKAEAEYQNGLILLKKAEELKTANCTTSTATNSSATAALEKPKKTVEQTTLEQAQLCFLKARRMDPKHMGARLELAKTYANGRGVPQDYKKAFDFYQEAKALGSLTAYAALGEFYHKGTGCTIDLKNALTCFETPARYFPNEKHVFLSLTQITYKLYDQSKGTDKVKYKDLYLQYAKHGSQLNIFSCIRSLLQYYTTQATDPDEQNQAYGYCQKIINHPKYMKNPANQLYQGMCLIYGFGITPNLKEGLILVDEALKFSDKLGPNNTAYAKASRSYALLTNTYTNPTEQKSCHEEAILLLEEVATAGSKVARDQLISYYIEPKKSNVAISPNLKRAKHWALIAAPDKSPDVLSWLAELQFNDREYYASLANFEQAQRLGNNYTHGRIGQIYLYGLGVPKDFKQAERSFFDYNKVNPAEASFLLAELFLAQKKPQFIDYLEISVKHKHQDALFFAGLFYFFGIGVTKNPEKGIDYLYQIYKNANLVFALMIHLFLDIFLSLHGASELENTLGADAQKKIFEMLELSTPFSKFGQFKSLTFAKPKTLTQKTKETDIETPKFFEAQLEKLKAINAILIESPSDPNQNLVTIFFEQLIKIFSSHARAANLCGLAKCYLLGQGTDKDLTLGTQYLKEAANLENAEAQYLFARENDSGNEQDKTMALHYYRLAAAQNHTLAKAHLNWKLQLKKDNDDYLVRILSASNKFEELTTIKQSFSPLIAEIEAIYSKIMAYNSTNNSKDTDNNINLPLQTSNWVDIEQVKSQALNLQTRANHLIETFDATYQKNYSECVAVCDTNNESAERFANEVESFELRYQYYYKEAKAYLDQLISYREKIEKSLESTNNTQKKKPKNNKNKTASTNSNANNSKSRSANINPNTSTNTSSNSKKQPETEARRLRQEKREAWLKAQKEFHEKQQKEQASNKKQKALTKDFIAELKYRSVASKAFERSPAGFAGISKKRTLLEWQTHELLRIEEERRTLDAAYQYITSMTITHENQTAEDLWVVRQGLIAIIGRFMELLQFIIVRQGSQSNTNNAASPSTEYLSLNTAAARIRNLLLKRDHLDNITATGPDLSESWVFEQHCKTNAALLSVAKTLVELPYFKNIKVSNFPSTWQQFKLELNSPLLEHMVEHVSPLAPILSFNDCVNKVVTARANLDKLSNYEGPHKNSSLVTIVDNLIKSKWGAVSAYVKKTMPIRSDQEVRIGREIELIRDDYIELGNRFRHAKEALRFTSSAVTPINVVTPNRVSSIASTAIVTTTSSSIASISTTATTFSTTISNTNK